jgi:hypothetical protein
MKVGPKCGYELTKSGKFYILESKDQNLKNKLKQGGGGIEP